MSLARTCTRPIIAVLLSCSVDAAIASQISFTASAAAEKGVEETVPRETAPLGGIVGTSLVNLGIDFSYGGLEGYYSDIDPNLKDSDSFFAFCGLNASAACDLGTSIDGRITLPSSGAGGVTRFLEIEAGFFNLTSNPRLRVFGSDGGLLSTVSGVRSASLTDQPIYAPMVFTVTRQGPDIAFFEFGMGEEDFQGFGVNRITLETPVELPVPGTLGLLGMGLVMFGAMRRRAQP